MSETMAQLWSAAAAAAAARDAVGAGGGLPRVPVDSAAAAPCPPLRRRAPSAATSDPDPATTTGSPVAPFCLHRDTAFSPAGAVCRDCGTVIADAACPTERGRQAPVMVRTAVAEGPGPGRAAEACRNEWNLHTAAIRDQPEEVLQGARAIFEEVYLHQGAVTGAKAQALVRVSLLFCGRRLHGADPANEERLIRHLPVSASQLNRAFTQMAAALATKRRAGA